MLSAGHLIKAKFAPQLIVLVLLVGLFPRLLFRLGISSMAIGLTFPALVLLICLIGFLTRRFRAFWIIWALATISSFILAGMVSPLATLPYLHIILPAYLP